MKNGQKKEDVKFTIRKSTLAKNLEDLMDARKIRVTQLANETGVTRQAIYNILNDKSVPRTDTLELLAEALSTDNEVITAEILKNGYVHFDYEYFLDKLRTTYLDRIDPKDLQEYVTVPPDGLADDFDIEGFLFCKFNIDPVLVFVNHCVPPKEIQNQIAAYFGFKAEDIFKIYGKFPIKRDPVISRVNVNNPKDFDNTRFEMIFNQLSLANKNAILNLCIDLLQIQNN